MNIRRNIARPAALAAAMSIAAAALFPATVRADESSSNWQWDGTIYMWMPEITGSANLPGGNTTNLDFKFHTLLDHLEAAAMGSLAVQKGEWGGFTDLIFMNLGAAKTSVRGGTIDGVAVPVDVTLNTNVGLKAWIWTLAASYRLKADPDSTLDLFGGTRLLELKPKLEYSFSADVGPFTGPGRSGKRSVTGDNWDAIVGLKGRAGFGEEHNWFVPYYVDVGTGDSQLTWQASVGIGYKFGWGDFFAKWRYLDYNIKSGNKLNDLTINGPLLGATWYW